jgi:hypothetical protein
MNESERDRRLDAAWSAASREQPPPALDAAIRAAARRAVDAAPGGGRSKHWWYPLAAAATVAVLAVGIARLTPTERVLPATVSDRGAAQPDLQRDGAPQVAAIQEPAAAPPPAAPAVVPAGEAQSRATPAAAAGAGTRARERARSAPADELRQQAVAAEAESAPPSRGAAAAPAMAAANTAPSAPASVPAVPGAPRAEPFPAAAPPLESHREGYHEEASVAEKNAPAKDRVEPVPAQSRALAAKVARADAAAPTEASARSVEAWIKRIRDLKNEGRLDEAAKELSMFRSAYGERADALLPADLREIKR